MRSLRVLLLVMLGTFAGQTPQAAEALKTIDFRTDVSFIQPERFSDVKQGGMNTPEGREAILAQLRGYLQQHAESRLAPGQRLMIAITDVDLAGDFEPRRRDPAGQVRIVKSIYPPRIDLGFKLIEAGGQVLKEGKRELRDLGFLSKGGPGTAEPLYYEKRLLEAWLREEFPETGR